ncbi:MAG TPA: dipeptide/oligopeptide/nickel ABC transporter ATP-binding protein [Spirochaetaceae bacterium]|nr:dipeptide/oligopeptide/nickel ABC transporter ATP-binding protein [Spirochaetaceae bacterium]
MNTQPILEIRNLTVGYGNQFGSDFISLDGVSMDVMPGEIFGIVGESGAGKTTLAMSIIGLSVFSDAFVGCDSMRFKGRDILHADREEMRRIRGKEIASVFQNASSSMNPVMRVLDQVAEMFAIHDGLNRRDSLEKAYVALENAGIPRDRAKGYPHAFSGGMLQRAMIASAVACRPSLLIADEPTASLDTVWQSRILDMILNLRDETGMSVVFISHDLRAVASICDRVAVMHSGKIVETADARSLFSNPHHSYTMDQLSGVSEIFRI